jgi:hypothetical protein
VYTCVWKCGQTTTTTDNTNSKQQTANNMQRNTHLLDGGVGGGEEVGPDAANVGAGDAAAFIRDLDHLGFRKSGKGGGKKLAHAV